MRVEHAVHMDATGRHAGAALAALIVVSAGLRGVVALGAEIPWIAPDEMFYALAGESLWERGTLTLRGLPAPYTSLVTPALVGAPLAAFGHETGIAVAQVLQSLVMTAAAIPVYLWARRLVAPRWALLAALLTVLVPALAYGGTLMTEAAFYPLTLGALATCALVLERPTLLRQGAFFSLVALAAAVRMQALVLVPTLVVAAVAHAQMTRSWSVARALAPLGALALAGATVAAVASATVSSGSALSDLLGAYQPVLDTPPNALDVVVSIAVHASGVPLVCLVLPLVGTTVVVADVVRARASDPIAAFVAIVLAYVPLLVVQVGGFAAQNVGYLSQRYLLTAAPVLFIGFAIWLDRGAPRPRAVVGATAAAILAAAALVPIDDVVPRTGAHDALWTTWLQGLTAESQAAARVALLVSAALVLGVLLVPRRRHAAAAVVTVAVGLVLTSVAATRTLLRESEAQQRAMIGAEPPAWIHPPAAGVTLLATGDHPSGAVARTFFWNPAVATVVRLTGADVTVPPSPPLVEIDGEGVLRTPEGSPLPHGYVLTSAAVTLEGELVAQRLDPTSQTPGWRLWRTSEAPRVTTRVIGALPNGDFSGQLTVLAPGCSAGALELTLLGKSGDPIAVTVDGIPWGEIQASNGVAVSHRVPATPYVDGRRTCVFSLAIDGYAGSTRIEYVPDSS
jgi:hypothetical protein